MGQIQIKLPKDKDRSYKILIQDGIFDKIPELISKKNYGRKYAIISDNTVARLYGGKIKNNLEKHGIKAHLFTFKAGDESKNLSTVEKLLDKMPHHRFDRSDAVIALGGGVSGDIGGFIASIYMRGIPYIQIPTTLLAMVDSSVGGKTGVNLKSGKNLAGTFNQPKAVYIDPQVLKTLPRNEYRSGLSEVVKYGVIYDREFFELLEKNTENLIKNLKHKKIIEKIISRCVQIKAEIVEKDEKESGLRMILNYGHTIGHAIETISKHKIPHGHAIAVGMKLVNKMAVMNDILSFKSAERINNLIKDLELEGKKAGSYTKNIETLWKIMQRDKKVKDGKITFIVPEKIGKVKYITDFKLSDLKKIF